MNLLSLTPLLLICCLLTSCSRDCPSDVMPDEPVQTFIPAEIGTVWRYVLLRGKNYSKKTYQDYEYTGDTLLVEVIDKDESGYWISEKISEGSAMHASDELYYWHKDTVFVNHWRIDSDNILIGQQNDISHISHLVYQELYPFPHWYSDAYGLPLLFSRGITKVEIEGWKTSHPYIESDAYCYTTDYELFGQFYDSLYIFINNTPMAGDGNGTTTIYNRKYGIVRSSVYSWWTQEGYGWDRLPD